MTIQLNILTKHSNLSLNIWKWKVSWRNRRNEEKKNDIIANNESTKKLKRKAPTKLDNAKRHLRNLVKNEIKHKLYEYELNGEKYISLKNLDSCNQEKWRQRKY